MASLIPGYEFDIFISYRQKDNKYDGWVTEFVDNLKRELESTFKDEISVYFDINPHDGLLETHDVDASLKEKLKCLVCIPIISRTYCDPKSFAWVNEFNTFIKQSSHDQFGLKVKLPNGNITNRVLPVRIHDLDASDIELLESTIGGVLRSIDFVYKETGVNRQLRAKDDDIIKTPGQILYRDQINKVALSVKDIIESMKSVAAKDRSKVEAEQKEIIPDEPGVVEKSETKKKLPSEKVQPGQDTRARSTPFKAKILVPGTLILLAIMSVVFLFFNHRTKVIWAKEDAIPEIDRLFNESKYLEAFNLSMKAERYMPKDSVLNEWISQVATSITITTDPPGAEVFIKQYSDTAGAWKKIGQTPIDSFRVPIATFYRVKFEKPGYETVLAVAFTDHNTLSRKLFEQGTIPEGMVYVDGYWDEVKDTFEEDKGFYIDRYEVTNKQYKEFVDKGGYRNRDYWKNEFIREGEKLTWEEAMAEFIDITGQPGPSTWEAGDYPEGQDNYPVSGVSWYEAAAYAEFAGKALPTGDHWDSGAGFYNMAYYTEIMPEICPLSNFNDSGSEPVGKNQGLTRYGALDMAGNVREWNWNKTTIGRIISGAGWGDPTYMFTLWDQLPSFDRSAQNGFRCALFIDKDKLPETAFRDEAIGTNDIRDYSNEEPVPESTFQVYKNQFLYDKHELNATIEYRDEKPDDWITEKVSFDAAYENDRVIAYLFLPRNSAPPYQTVIFFPGSYALTSNDLMNNGGVNSFLSFILKSGRAVLYPVYFRTFERHDEQMPSFKYQSHQYTGALIKYVKDFSRSIDYLESRPDIDTSRLGYLGHSWGGELGAIIPAVERRLAVNMLLVGGLIPGKPYPEADGINYVSRVNIPTLMLNGRYDHIFDLDKSVIPFFKLLAAPEADKRLCVYETGHSLPKRDIIKEILNWLDKYFGPVNSLENK